MTRILDEVDGALADGGSVYVHCWGGSAGGNGRRLLARAARAGGGDAVARIAELRRTVSDVASRSPETAAQRAMVEAWKRGR